MTMAASNDRETGPEWPSALVVGNDLPHLAQAGSILLHRLFQGWRPAALVAMGPPRPQSAGSLECEFVAFEPPHERLERTRFFRLGRLVHSLGCMPTGQILQCLPDGFRPQVIVHVLCSLGYAEAVYQYSLQSGVPVVLIIHDDPDDFNQGYSWAGGLARRRFRRIYTHAARRLCVSPEMEELMHARYGVRGEVMYPNRSENTTPRPLEEVAQLKQPGVLTLGYAGALNYGYGPRLQELLPLLREAGVRLRVYGGTLAGSESDAVVNLGRISPPEQLWERVKAECDAVILPYCFANHGHQDLYRTHFPSKLPEYLALGMPVVVAGPDHATGVKWGLQNPSACVTLTSPDGPEWLATMKRLRDDKEWREALAANAVSSGRRDFDPFVIRSRFQQTLRRVARRDDRS